MIEVIFHWHSFVEIEYSEGSILIDPFVNWNPNCDLTIDEICKKNIVAVWITHWHSDHIWDTVNIVKKTWAKVISIFEIIQYFSKFHNIESSHAMHIWWEYNFGNFSVKFVNAIHWWSIWYEMLPGKAAWIIIKVNWTKIYHAWDTALTYDMKLLELDSIDLALLPIWGNFTMWVEDAVKAVEFIKPKIVVPIHYNTFELIKADPVEFAQKVTLSNLAICKVLSPGQKVVLWTK